MTTANHAAEANAKFWAGLAGWKARVGVRNRMDVINDEYLLGRIGEDAFFAEMRELKALLETL